MSADEDSFIVLEETPSMLQFSILDTSAVNKQCAENNGLFETNTFLSDNEIDIGDMRVKQEIVNASNVLNLIETKGENQPTAVTASTEMKKQMLHEVIFAHQATPTTSLAHSFLLGDINCDKMKSYFPSTGNLGPKEDVEKWRTLIQERNDLKDALQRTNATMRQQYSMVNDWHNSVKDLKENHERELKKFRIINDELFVQNHDLQGKVAELQHLADLNRKARIHSEEEQMITDKLKNEQLQKQVQSLKLELANTIALNVDTDEAYRENVKKGEKLQVELVAIQELYKNASAEIASLRAQNDHLRRDLEKTNSLVAEYRENANLTQTQCDIYRNDFEMERKQREEMAAEREQLISDIRMLKKRNQALVDEAQSYYNEMSTTSLSSSVPNRSIEDNNEAQQFICPLCSQSFEILNDLESHVQSCLEKNG